MPIRRPRSAAMSLLELLMVIAVVGILVGMLLPTTDPTGYDQLRSAAAMLAADLEYGRSLAVANNGTYQFTIDNQTNQYILQYSGSNPALNALPATPFRSPSDPPNQYIVPLASLPHLGQPAWLAAAGIATSPQQQVNTVEFQPLGGTTASSATIIWLASGVGANKRYITVTVDPTTGLTTIGPYGSAGPPASFTVGGG